MKNSKGFLKFFAVALVAILATTSCSYDETDTKWEGGSNAAGTETEKATITLNLPELDDVSVYSTPTTDELTIKDVAVIITRSNIYQGCEVVSGASLATQISGLSTNKQILTLFTLNPKKNDVCYVIANSGLSKTEIETALASPVIGTTTITAADMHDKLKIDATSSAHGLTYKESNLETIPFSGKSIWWSDKATTVNMKFALAKVTLNVDPSLTAAGGAFAGKTITFQVYNDNATGCFFPDAIPCNAEDTTTVVGYAQKDAISGTTIGLGKTVACIETINRTKKYSVPGMYAGTYRDSIAFNKKSPYVEVTVEEGGVKEYYRLDFYDPLAKEILDVKRHTAYSFTITGVKSKGYSNRAECWQQAGSNLEYKLESGDDSKMAVFSNGQYGIKMSYEACIVYGDAGATEVYHLSDVGFSDKDIATSNITTNSITASPGINILGGITTVPLSGKTVPINVTFDAGVTVGQIDIRVGNVMTTIPVMRKDKLSCDPITFEVQKTRRAERISENEDILGFSSMETPLTDDDILDVFYSDTLAHCYLHVTGNNDDTIRRTEAAFYDCENLNFKNKVVKVILTQEVGIPVGLTLIVCPWDTEYAIEYVGAYLNVSPDEATVPVNTLTDPYTSDKVVWVDFNSNVDVQVYRVTGWLDQDTIQASLDTIVDKTHGRIKLRYKDGAPIGNNYYSNPGTLTATITLRAGTTMFTFFVYPTVDKVWIPDDNFRQYLKNKFSYVLYEDSLVVFKAKEMSFQFQMDQSSSGGQGNGIKKLNGIENFKHLTYLNTQYNPIDSIDLSQNHELRTLNAGQFTYENGVYTRNTPLKYINVQGCDSLYWIDVKNTKLLDTIDISNLKNLRSAYLNYNLGLTTINTAGCENLTDLSISQCPLIKELDVTGLGKLQSLDFSSCAGLESFSSRQCNSLKFISASCSANLKTFDAGDMDSITSVNISQCRRLETVKLDNNPLLYSVSACYTPSLSTLDISGTTFNNTAIIDPSINWDEGGTPNSYDNKHYEYINLRTWYRNFDGDDGYWDTHNCGWSTYRCFLGVDNGGNEIYDDFSSYGGYYTGYGSSGEYYSGKYDDYVPNEYIGNYCVPLYYNTGVSLYLDGTGLETVDVSGKTALENLSVESYLDYNSGAYTAIGVSTLNISNCSALKNLGIGNNKLSSVNTSTNSELRGLKISAREKINDSPISINSIDFSNNHKLIGLNILFYQGSENWDFVANQPNLRFLYLYECPNLTYKTAGLQKLEIIQVRAYNNDIDISNCPSLERADILKSTKSADDGISNTLTLGGNNKLKFLAISGSHLNNTYYSYNRINVEDYRNVDFGGCPNLVALYLFYYGGETLDVSNCPNLKALNIRYASVKNVNLSNSRKLQFFDTKGFGGKDAYCGNYEDYYSKAFRSGYYNFDHMPYVEKLDFSNCDSLLLMRIVGATSTSFSQIIDGFYVYFPSAYVGHMSDTLMIIDLGSNLKQNLQYMFLNNSPIKDVVNLDAAPNLKTFTCDYSMFGSNTIDITQNDNLTLVHCGQQQEVKLDSVIASKYDSESHTDVYRWFTYFKPISSNVTLSMTTSWYDINWFNRLDQRTENIGVTPLKN